MGRAMDYQGTPHATTDLADLRAAKRALAEAVWRAESAIAEMTRAANRVRGLMGFPLIDPFELHPDALAQDAAMARAGWDRAHLATAQRSEEWLL